MKLIKEKEIRISIQFIPKKLKKKIKMKLSIPIYLLIYLSAILSGFPEKVDSQSVNSCSKPGQRNDMYSTYEGVQPSSKLSAFPDKYVVRAKAERLVQCYALCSINCSCGFVAFQAPDDCVMYDVTAFKLFEQNDKRSFNLFYKNS